MLDSHEAHDVTKQTHRDGDDMTYAPVSPSVSDNRTSTQRIDELTGALTALIHRVRRLEQQIERMTGD